MLGLFGMIMVFLVQICLFSYWISWEMQNKQKRPAFTTQVRNDLVGLFAKSRGLVRNPGSRWDATKPVRLEPANGRQSAEAPILLGKPAASKL
jgi:hypothetical protein